MMGSARGSRLSVVLWAAFGAVHTQPLYGRRDPERNHWRSAYLV